MGNFNFECDECGWGEGGDGEDGRDYFGKPAAAVLEGADGKVILLKGEYTGYGEIELPSGHTFWPDQFEQYFDGWLSGKGNGEKGPFRCRGILCENCMDYKHQTPFSEFSFFDFVKVKDYLEKQKVPPAPVTSPPAPVAAPKKVKVLKVAKPKPLTKEELVAKVAELEEEVARLRPLQERMDSLQKAYDDMQKRSNRSEGTIAAIQRALNENRYW